MTVQSNEGKGRRLPTKLKAGEFKKLIAETAAELRRTIEAEVTGLDESPAAVASRRAQALADDGFEFFCRTYFPHYLKSKSASRLHVWLFKRLPEIAMEGGGARQVVKAPRGEAKSTICTQLHTLWQIARRSAGKGKHYIIIIMDVFVQAALMVEAIKAELEANPRLKLDYPEICGAGRLWREDQIVTANGVKVDAVGAGQKLRGRRHGPHRPDLALLDDIENDEAVKSKEQREKLDKWVDRAVLNLGSADGSMDVIYVGTVLHPDAVIVRKAKNPMWRAAHFKSIEQWPDRLDLWDRYEEILRNSAGDDEDKQRAKAEAEAFWQANQAAMEAGAVVSWPEVRPLKKLMDLRISIGRQSFNSEQQNTPNDNEDAPFQNLSFWVVRLSQWIFGGACDPSLGKSDRKGDPSAILVLGLNRETGIVDVVEASIRRRVPTTIIADVIAFQRQYGCLLWGIETVQFQAFFAQVLVAESAVAGVPVPAIGIENRIDKDLRIMSLQPHTSNGLIRFHASQSTLIEQLEQYGTAGTHDDGPDCLEMGWQVMARLRSGSGFLTGGSRVLIGHGQGFTDAPSHGQRFNFGDDALPGWRDQLTGYLQ